MARYMEPEPRISIAKIASWVNPVSGNEAEDVKIRKAEAADAETIFGMLNDLRDEEAKKRPDIVKRDEELLSLEEVAAAIEDPAKLIFLAENGDGEVVGQILCELEMKEEDEAVEEAAEPAAEAVEEVAEEAAEPVAEAVEEAAEPAAEAVEEAVETVAEAAEGVVESVAEAAEPVPAVPMPVEAEPEPVEEVKGPRAEKLVIANIYVVDSARRQRVGTELYHEALREARKMGCTAAELSCWNFDKEGVYFFEKLGYKSLLVTMEKKLGD